ncbi:hypothetical protein ZIOFF_055940 [Zingiber officinale]|uniref:Uncharacterized protein n=1 Tax=Zingiber officinale TaxID=94328 RepID=A0A8J5KQ93_ZINOF|nr:hypothetical protein ZIOFF_055940 [Zingiber officinale]
MAASSVDRSPLPAQVVGKAFVQQYYLILQQSPELVHRFYQENSLLSRPDANGEMSLVTTTQAINQKVLSMGAVRAETKTVDAQESLGGGVTVLVTGYLSEVDSIKRGFTQSFFLAPQDKGFFVLNDIFRFVEEGEHQQGNQGCPPQQEPHDPDQTASEDDDKLNSGEVYNPPEDGQFVEHEEPKEEVIIEVPNSSQAVAVEPTPVTAQEDMPKKSYASIVKVMKHSALASIPAHMLSKSASVRPESEATTAPSAVPANDVPTTNSVNEESSNAVEAEADGHSIFVKSLPLDATPDQLEQEFKKFGTIVPDGIQVRSHKLQGFCYGFVTFETASAVQKSLEAIEGHLTPDSLSLAHNDRWSTSLCERKEDDRFTSYHAKATQLVTKEDMHLVEGAGYAMIPEGAVASVAEGLMEEATMIPHLILEDEVVVGEGIKTVQVMVVIRGLIVSTPQVAMEPMLALQLEYLPKTKQSGLRFHFHLKLSF